MGYLNQLKPGVFHCLYHYFFFHIQDSRGDIISTLFHLIYDNRCERHQYICQDICCYDIVFLITDLILYFFIINDITLNNLKLLLIYIVLLCIFL